MSVTRILKALSFFIIYCLFTRISALPTIPLNDEYWTLSSLCAALKFHKKPSKIVAKLFKTFTKYRYIISNLSYLILSLTVLFSVCDCFIHQFLLLLCKFHLWHSLKCRIKNNLRVSHILLLLSALFPSFYFSAGELYSHFHQTLFFNQNKFWENAHAQ